MNTPDNLTKFCPHCKDVSAILTSPAPHKISVDVCPCKCHYYGKINYDNRELNKPRGRKRK